MVITILIIKRQVKTFVILFNLYIQVNCKEKKQQQQMYSTRDKIIRLTYNRKSESQLKKAHCIQTNIDIKFEDKKLLIKKQQPITRSALVGMQLIQVCIWSVVIVTAENSTLTLPLHRPPAKQTDIQTSERTNKQTKCPSTVSKVLRCQEKPINYNDTIFENNFFNLKCPYWNQSVLQFEHGAMSAAITDTK